MNSSTNDDSSRYPLFWEALQAHCPGALPLEEYMQRTSSRLAIYGFDDENTLGMVSVCRDEIAAPLLREVIRYWGKTFDCRSLGGSLSMGKSGIETALTHTPIVEGIRRFAFYAMPHVAISEKGEIGTVYRESIQQTSHACGSLIGILKELESGRINVETDLEDIEQCSLRQKLLSAIRYGDVPDLMTLTKLAGKIIDDDIDRLLRHVDAAAFHYVVMTGILIHGPAETQWIFPRHSRVVGAHVPGGRIVLDLEHPSA